MAWTIGAKIMFDVCDEHVDEATAEIATRFPGMPIERMQREECTTVTVTPRSEAEASDFIAYSEWVGLDSGAAEFDRKQKEKEATLPN